MLSWSRALCAALSALAVAACAQAPGQPKDAPGQITTGSIARKGPDTENKIKNLTGAEFTFSAPGAPADVYVLLARGAMSCWLGPVGPMRRSHVFAADVDPPAKGGAALITLHEKDPSLPDQRGVPAVQVALSAAPGGTQVAVATPKMAPEISDAMKQDILAWARAKPGCAVGAILAPTPTTMANQGAARSKSKARTTP